MTTTMNQEPPREFLTLNQMEPWGRNPRGGELREMEAFTEQLRLEGVREDVHVFRATTGRLTIMQGHRRYAAAVKLELAGLWAKVWPFDEADAFRHLMTMQNGGDPFDARELAAAAREAISMGIPSEELPGIFHRSAETVQLYLDLGKLPHRVQEAVHKGKMALGTAGLLRQLTTEQMALALDGVLSNPLTKEPMSEAQARVYIEATFLKPAKQAKEWQVVSRKVRKQLIGEGLDEGLIDVVAWENREQFVDSGALPQSAYARCDEHIEDRLLVKPAEPITWGQLARSLGVPWHLCPAPVPESRHLCLVKRSAVIDADDVAAEGTWVLKGKAWKRGQQSQAFLDDQQAKRAVGDEAEQAGSLSHDEEPSEQMDSLSHEEEPIAFDMARWQAVVARLMARKESVMQDALWKPLVPVMRAAVRTLAPDAVASCEAVLEADDSINRRGLRHVMAWLLALNAAHGSTQAQEEIEEALGVKP